MTMSVNAKTKNNGALPPETEAGVLQEFDRLREVLATTHSQIPQLLARERAVSRELGLAESAELQRELQGVVNAREAAARRRMAAVSSILALEAALQAERLAVEVERGQYALRAVAAFQARYSAAVSVLQGLWEEGRSLGMALRCVVEMPLPTRVVESPVDGVARGVPIRSNVAVTLDEQAARLGAKLDQLDGALAVVNAIRQSREFDSRGHRMGLLRGTASEFNGVYRVIAPFRNLVDGCEFQVGQLIDSSLIGSGMMHRLMTGRRFIEPVGLTSAAA
jgi:hypothetical protein